MRLWLLVVFLVVATVREGYGSEGPDEAVLPPHHSSSAHGDEWIDPNDPFAGRRQAEAWIDPNDPTNKNGPRLVHSTGVKTPTPSPHAEQSLRLILRELFHDLGVDTAQGSTFTRQALLHLSDAQVEAVERFLESKHEDSSWEAHEALRAALSGMVTLLPDYVEPSLGERIVTIVAPYLQMANVFVLLPASVLLLSFLIRTRSLLLIAFLSIFAFSLWTTYDRRYKEAMAARLEASTRLKDACRPPSLLDSAVAGFSSLLFLPRKSDCRQFIESQTIDVVSEIQLTDVLAEVVFSGFLSFLGQLGRHLNSFFINIYAGLPIPLAFLVTMFIGVFSLFALFFSFGYRITAPFLSFEPHGPSPLAQVVGAALHGVQRVTQASPVAALVGGERRGEGGGGQGRLAPVTGGGQQALPPPPTVAAMENKREGEGTDAACTPPQKRQRSGDLYGAFVIPPYSEERFRELNDLSPARCEALSSKVTPRSTQRRSRMKQPPPEHDPLGRRSVSMTRIEVSPKRDWAKIDKPVLRL